MADEKKLDLLSLEVAIEREVAYRNKNKALRWWDSSSLELATERELAHGNKTEAGGTLKRTASFGDWMKMGPTSNMSLQNLALHQSSLTAPSSDEQPDSKSLLSAKKDWIGPSKLSDDKFQVQKPKLFPKLNVPTKARSDLKRKAAPDNQIQSLQSSSHKMIKKSADNLVCEICQVSCSSKLTLHQHLIGRPHKAKLEFMKLKRNCSNGGKRGKPRCEVCQIWCSDRDALNMHFKGQKHKNKMHELEACKKNGAGGNEITAKKPILCELCLVPCMNEDLFEMHLKGRQHAAKQELRRRGML